MNLKIISVSFASTLIILIKGIETALYVLILLMLVNLITKCIVSYKIKIVSVNFVLQTILVRISMLTLVIIGSAIDYYFIGDSIFKFATLFFFCVAESVEILNNINILKEKSKLHKLLNAN